MYIYIYIVHSFVANFKAYGARSWHSIGNIPWAQTSKRHNFTTFKGTQHYPSYIGWLFCRHDFGKACARIWCVCQALSYIASCEMSGIVSGHILEAKGFVVASSDWTNRIAICFALVCKDQDTLLFKRIHVRLIPWSDKLYVVIVVSEYMCATSHSGITLGTFRICCNVVQLRWYLTCSVQIARSN